MHPSTRSRFVAAVAILVLLAAGSAVRAQCSDCVHKLLFGPLPSTAPPGGAYPTFYSPDWGPGMAQYGQWPTLREALDEYGWFGRKYGKTHYSAPVVTQPVFVVPPPTPPQPIEIVPPPKR